ncbi:MAG: TraB/GumN family protein [Pseudomonadota bacterium]
MRLRPLVAVFAGWALALALTGCASEPVPDQPEPSPPLFAIEGADGTIKGWLMGTIHALPDGVRWRTDAIEQVIEAADRVIVEVADPTSDETRAVFAQLAATPNLPPLAQRVAPSLRGDLLQLMKKAGVTPGDFRATETWAAALSLAQAATPGSRSNSVDVAIIAQFPKDRVTQLEGAATQLAIFDALEDADQRALLEGIVREAETVTQRAHELDRAWLTGDLDAIETATGTGFLTDPQLRAALLTDRNTAWAAQLAPDLAGETRPLIAVGAAHLPGPEGLISLLEGNGFILRQLR